MSACVVLTPLHATAGVSVSGATGTSCKPALILRDYRSSTNLKKSVESSRGPRGERGTIPPVLAAAYHTPGIATVPCPVCAG